MNNVQAIATKFDNKTLPKQEWTHHAHMAVALAKLYPHNSVEQTLPMMRDGIKAYNIAVGTENTDTSGYHETLTVFWLQVVQAYCAAFQPKGIEEMYDSLIQTSLATTNFPLQFYSRELLFSTHARHQWIEPDIQGLEAMQTIIAQQVSQ
jgi:hypothetical protein